MGGRSVIELLSVDLGALVSSELFPSRWSIVVFLLYMALFINQGILVTASRRGANTYEYNPTTVVLLTELVKLLVSCALYMKDHSASNLGSEVLLHYKMFLHYLVPSALYCAYNNLSFLNLAVFDPTTYFLLLQFRVVVTGVTYQCIFRRLLSLRQWISLIILTVGCVVKNLGLVSKRQEGDSSSILNDTSFWVNLGHAVFSLSILFIFVQILSSSVAGVYNEFLLKKLSHGVEVDLHLQNVCMYVDSILCNFALLGASTSFATAFFQPQNTPSQVSDMASVISWNAVKNIWSPLVILLIFNNAAIGIVTAIFLKTFNSILKTFASALELMFTAVLCWVIFGISIDGYTVTAIFIVSYSIIVYAQNPVPQEGGSSSQIHPSRTHLRQFSKEESTSLLDEDVAESPC